MPEYLRLVQDDEVEPHYPDFVRDVTDRLCDAGNTDMAVRVVKAYVRFEQTMVQAYFALEQPDEGA